MKKLISILLSVLVLCCTLSACGKSEEVKQVDQAIEEVKLHPDDKALIGKARKLYDGLSEEMQKEVSGLDALLEAEKNLDKFDFIQVDIKIPIYEVVEQSVSGMKPKEYSDFVFDDKGRLVQKKEGKNDSCIIDYTYDDQDQLVKEVRTTKSFKEVVKETYTYTYNDHGEIASTTEAYFGEDGVSKPSTKYNRDGNRWEYEYEYDEQGRVIKKIEVLKNDDSDHSMIYKYEYDSTGKVSTEWEISMEGDQKKSEWEIKPVYDERGNKIESHAKDLLSGDKLDQRWKYAEVGYKNYSVGNGRVLPSEQWVSFDEIHGFPSPDSCVVAISSDKKESPSYTYKLPEDPVEAEDCCFAYTKILEDYCGFKIVKEADVTNIIRDGDILATMKADPTGSHTLQIELKQ